MAVSEQITPLSPEQFSALAAGFGGAEELDVLRHNQRLLRNYVIGEVGHNLRVKNTDLHTRFNRVADAASQITLDDPASDAWALSALRASREHHFNSATEQRIMRLGGFAAAAMLTQTAEDFAVETPIEPDGYVDLSMLGSVALRGSSASAIMQRQNNRIFANHGPESTELPNDLDLETIIWRPVQKLRAEAHGLKLTLAINNSRALSELFDQPLAAPLAPLELSQWQATLNDAWQILVRHHPQYASGLAAGLQTIIPLVSIDGRERAMTLGFGFGAIAMTKPPTSEQLAWFLVHKFQNSKFRNLDATEVLVPTDDNRLIEVPWKGTPLRGHELLEYAYSHVSSMNFWRVQAGLHPQGSAEQDSANKQYRYWRRYVAMLVHEINKHNILSDKSSQVLAQVQNSLDQMP